MSDWGKFFRDLSSTRIQITYWIMVLVTLVVLKALSLVKTPQDGVALLNVMWPLVMLVLGAYVGGAAINAQSVKNGPTQ